MKQLAGFGIVPHRFPAVYGWSLTQGVFDEIGMQFFPPMDFRYDGQVFFQFSSVLAGEKEPLNETCYGKTCVHESTTPGALGLFLSFLSVLQDAYDSNYQTIWILEDDFTLDGDPHLLSSYIEKLDSLVGKNNWDLLYTDDDHILGSPFGYAKMDIRPDRPPFFHLFEHTEVGEDFFRIGARWQLHSVIYRRPAIKKILSYFKKHGIFRPVDADINFIPDVKKYSLKRGLIHGRERNCSDTLYRCF